MPVTWTDFVLADTTAGARLKDAIWQAYEDNDEAGQDHVFQIEFAQANWSAAIFPTYETLYQFYAVVPDGSTVLRAVYDMGSLFAWTGTFYSRVRIASSFLSDVQTIVNPTAGQQVEKTFTATGLSSLRGTRALVELQAACSVSPAGGTPYLICTSKLCSRFSFD